jgi:Tol biopolymer transport system component
VLIWSVIALVTVGLATISFGSRRSSSPAAAPLRLALVPPADLALESGTDYPFGLAVAPDGRRLAFPASRSGLAQLWLHDLSTTDSQPLAGTDNGVLPFWSPDGRAVAFFTHGELRVLTLDDGMVRTLAPAPSPRGGVWHTNGDIIFAPDANAGLSRRRASDGVVATLTTPDGANGESSHRFPALSDGGRRVVFFVRASQPARQGIWSAPLDAPAARTRLASSDSHALAVDDAVVYASGGALVAEQIDPRKGTSLGRPMMIGAAVGQSAQNQLFASLGGDLLLFGAAVSTRRELRWLDRRGGAAGSIGEPMDAWDVRIAPGRSSIAVARLDPQLATLDIWMYDGERPLPRRISPAIDRDESPVWSRDGTRVAWVSGRQTVTVRGALAELPEIALHKFEHSARVTDWSPDGRWIIVAESRPESRDDLWLLSPNGDAVRPYVRAPFNETQGVVSPDGQWMAYASDESGRFEVYVDSFPAPGTRGRLTIGGGTEPRWRADGSEIYFRRGTEIHAVKPLLSTAAVEAAASERLFDAGADIRAFDVTSDGQRFLVNLPAPDNTPPSLSAIVNASALIRGNR